MSRSALRRFSQLVSRTNRPATTNILSKSVSFQSNDISLFTPKRFISLSHRLNTEAGSGIETRLESMVNQADVVVFMKGVPSAPRCGFSNAVCQIMRMHDVSFESHDVLADEEVRQGIKDYSNWPTIPQVYFKGEFIGGCDILLQMHQSGELIEELQKIGITSALLEPDEAGKDK